MLLSRGYGTVRLGETFKTVPVRQQTVCCRVSPVRSLCPNHLHLTARPHSRAFARRRSLRNAALTQSALAGLTLSFSSRCLAARAVALFAASSSSPASLAHPQPDRRRTARPPANCLFAPRPAVSPCFESLAAAAPKPRQTSPRSSGLPTPTASTLCYTHRNRSEVQS